MYPPKIVIVATKVGSVCLGGQNSLPVCTGTENNGVKLAGLLTFSFLQRLTLAFIGDRGAGAPVLVLASGTDRG